MHRFKLLSVSLGILPFLLPDLASSLTTVPMVERMLLDSMSGLPISSPFEAENATRLAELVFDSMTTRGREYHSMQHVFDVTRTMEDPILVLSAMFHDVIYFSIDNEFLDKQWEFFDGVLVSRDTEPFALVEDFDVPDGDLLRKVARLYGFNPGEDLPVQGTNEFLSGVMAVRALSPWLGTPHLMQVAACIEGTIPFRPPDEDGKTPMDRLYDRLKVVCPDQSEEWLVETINMSTETANWDLSSFDSTDKDFFLDSSWRLLPEARPRLLDEDCPIAEMVDELNALEGRTNFLKGIVPRIHQQFRRWPTDEVMEGKRRRTRENLDLCLVYGRIRLLQAMVLVRFLEAVGEDSRYYPMRPCLEMDVPEVRIEGARSPPGTGVELQIRHWLVHGRTQSFAWDPATSSLAAYLFDNLGAEAIEAAVEVGRKTEPGSLELLELLPKPVLRTIALRLGAILPHRAELLLRVTEKFDVCAQ